jgi:lipopolysaccharide biosynthesis regulator YciM
MALLTLYERSRDWPQAIATARGLEGAAVGSFAHRVAHYECERALEAQARGEDVMADKALVSATQAAPELARPWVMLGQCRMREGQPAQALQAWAVLRQRAAEHFPLVADDYARAALAARQPSEALAELEKAYAASQDLRILRALEWLGAQNRGVDLSHAAARDDSSATPDGPSARKAESDTVSVTSERLNEHLRRQPSLSAVDDMLQRPLESWHEDTPALLRKAVERAAAPLQRFRCAACGFEARQYFWQCPGCQGWDTFPPRQLEAG